MNNINIGNARQWDDNRIAVHQAMALGHCCRDLSMIFARDELRQSDYVPAQLAHYKHLALGIILPIDPKELDLARQDWVRCAIMEDKAANILRSAIANGTLPIWRIHDAREVLVTPTRLDIGNIKHGIFKSLNRPEPDMNGALLWVKNSDWRDFLAATVTAPHPGHAGGKVPKNRQLNYDEIIGQAISMLTDQPGISKGSAAASIVADLPRNPKTGKPRDTRHIERMIAHLWEGGLSQSPR